MRKNPGYHTVWCACFLLLMAFTCSEASAQISPGDLSSAHADLEGIANCTRCHQLRQQGLDPDRCLECHVLLREMIDRGQGYHVSEAVAGKDCADCHVEHLGRDFDIVHWPNGKHVYDHDLTGFGLVGRHDRIGCPECHTPLLINLEERLMENLNLQTTYLGLDGNCTSCHHDEHQEQLHDDCIQCHSFEGWTPAPGFDHDSTDHPLTGRHTQLECVQCHTLIEVPQRPDRYIIRKSNRSRRGLYAQYEGIEHEQCIDCHVDPHGNRFGSNCEECHSTAGFKRAERDDFDHSLTAFSLEGRHMEVTCEQCHTSGDMTEPLEYANCNNCHEDEHRGQFLSRDDNGNCSTCHTVQGFSPAIYTFEDHNRSGFPLTGSHMAIPCINCHTTIASDEGDEYTKFEFVDFGCNSCHENIHGDEIGHCVENNDCSYCHSTATWRESSFDHSLSRFPLEGRHNEIECRLCHLITEDLESLVVLKPLPVQCAGCHDDIHYGQFDSADVSDNTDVCSTCHSPQGWDELLFNHNTDTGFVLEGGHENVACIQCHATLTNIDGTIYLQYRSTPTECSECHGGEDEE